MAVYTYKTILEKAKSCRTNVKKEYKNGISTKWSYYICKSIISPKKDIKKISIGDAPSPTGEKVNKTVKKQDYMKSIKNYVAYIEKNKRLPNYVTVVGVKIKPHLFTAFVSFILAKGIPATQGLKSSIYTKPKSKYGHATAHGCDQMGQNNGYYCGCHSLQEVFRNLTGKVVKQSTIASVAGTTTSGTDHNGLNTAVVWFNKKYGYNLKVEWKNFSDLGWSGLKKIVESENKDCVIHNLYRNKYGHYEVINNVSGSNIKVQNSLGDKCTSSCYCGYVEDRSPATYRSYISGISQKSIMVISK